MQPIHLALLSLVVLISLALYARWQISRRRAEREAQEHGPPVAQTNLNWRHSPSIPKAQAASYDPPFGTTRTVRHQHLTEAARLHLEPSVRRDREPDPILNPADPTGLLNPLNTYSPLSPLYSSHQSEHSAPEPRHEPSSFGSSIANAGLSGADYGGSSGSSSSSYESSSSSYDSGSSYSSSDSGSSSSYDSSSSSSSDSGSW